MGAFDSIGTLCGLIRDSRSHKLRIRDIAEVCGYEQSMMYKFEQGLRNLDEVEFKKYVEVLQLPFPQQVKVLQSLHRGSLQILENCQESPACCHP